MTERKYSRVKYFILTGIGLLIASGAGGYFEYICREVINTPHLPFTLWLTLTFVEGAGWFTVAMILLCILGVWRRKDNCTFGTAFQLFLVCLHMGFGCFHLRSLKEYHYRQSDAMTFSLPANANQTGFFEKEDSYYEYAKRIQHWRFYKYMDRIQRDKKCCGMKGPTDWDNPKVHEWLHADLRRSCKEDLRDVHKACYPILQFSEKFPPSCCKTGNGKPCNPTDRHMNGCNTYMKKHVTECLTRAPFLGIPSLVIAIYMTIVTYAHARAVQNRSFCTKLFCRCCRKKREKADVPSSDQAVAVPELEHPSLSLESTHATKPRHSQYSQHFHFSKEKMALVKERAERANKELAKDKSSLP